MSDPRPCYGCVQKMLSILLIVSPFAKVVATKSGHCDESTGDASEPHAENPENFLSQALSGSLSRGVQALGFPQRREPKASTILKTHPPSAETQMRVWD